MTKNEQKMAQNDQKTLKKWVKMSKNGQTMARIDQKNSKIMGQNVQKWSKNSKKQ